jgi:hypothetical protein
MSERDGLSRDLGISRRELIRRGAVVGGTLVWAAPVIQSLTPPAYAQATPAQCGCCYCWSGDMQAPSKDLCLDNSSSGFLASAEECRRWCSDVGPNAPYQNSQWCRGSGCRCVSENDNLQEPNGCTCR